MITQVQHISVMPDEVLQLLSPKAGHYYLDGTLGLAGHSAKILQLSDGKAFLCGLDRDPQAIEIAEKNLSPWQNQCRIFQKDFADFEEIMPELNWPHFNGVLLDLGISSLQLDLPERGFSHRTNGPLDMRMDISTLGRAHAKPYSQSAKVFVNNAALSTIANVIKEYGEDPQSSRIAKAIVDARIRGSIETTQQLADIVYYAYPVKWRTTARNHPATRTFQAIRMYVNDELGQLERFLQNILAYMAPDAIIAVLSFHSLEDRIVKQTFKRWATNCICAAHIPICKCNHKAEANILTRKPLVPTRAEILRNPRSSSAKLRASQKI